jgi:hypothetical protein
VNRARGRLPLVLATTLAVALVLVAVPVRTTVHAAAWTEGQLVIPFARGVTWTVCRGYNVRSHRHSTSFDTYFGLDLTTDPGPHGSTGCRAAGRQAATGRLVYAPATGWATLRGNDRICLRLDRAAGGSLYLAHMTHRVRGRVIAGTTLVGRVRPPADDAGNYAHLHIHAHRSNDCSGPTVPFAYARGFKFRSAPDLPDKGASVTNQYAGANPVRLRRP